MAVLQWWNRSNVLPEIPQNAPMRVREITRRRQLVSTILLVVAGFQLVNLPGALIDKSPPALGTVVVGLVICGVAMVLNPGGKGIISLVYPRICIGCVVWTTEGCQDKDV